MGKQAKHTPGQLVTGDPITEDDTYFVTLYAGKVFGPVVADAQSEDLPYEECNANAQRLALAWNCHDELLWVLRQIMEDLPQNRDWLDPMLEANAKAIIAKAEGGRP